MWPKLSLVLVLFLFATTTSALAQAGGQKPLITCWYNESGAYTGSDTATPDARPGGPFKSGQGDYAWSYNISAPNGQSCPKTKPGK
ncbi:MAG TPA: hypothetical protein VGH23_10655 [Rhizomicrobium sp.]|jgi:hypothetical protein